VRILYLSAARIPSEKAHALQTLQTAAAMRAEGHDVELWRPYRASDAALLRALDPSQTLGVPLRVVASPDLLPLERRLPARLAVPMFALQSALYGLAAAARARRRGADLYFTREWLVALWLDRLGMPYVLEEHRSHRERPATQRRIAAMARRRPMRRLAVVTRGLAEAYAAAGVPVEKIAVVPDAVDVDLFGEELPAAAARQEFGLPPDRAIVGYVGRFQTMNAEKGIVDVLDAAAASADPAVRGALYAFVGGPIELAPGYRATARARGLPESATAFYDRVAHQRVPRLLRAFDVCVMPFPDAPHYRHDMSPLKMFEYMAAARPIVATELPSIREVLDDGQTALLVPPGDPAALAAAIGRLLADAPLRARLGEAAAREAQRYSWRGRARALLDGLDHSR
jgi:glycosyltransferase involved in cell wall biosynthesis